jgi:uncharacterized protein DUF1844
MSEEKKIIVDEDWKEQAQREKEMLAAALEKEKEPKRPAPPEEATFAMLATGLATQALLSLGDLEDPHTKKHETNLPEARFHINMLEMLDQKTKGNLTPDEAHMMQTLLFDLRMRFVGKSK